MPEQHAAPFTFFGAFGGYGSVSRVLGLMGNTPLGYLDSNHAARTDYAQGFPDVPAGGSLDDVLAGGEVLDAARAAKVLFTTPPSRAFSTAGHMMGRCCARWGVLCAASAPNAARGHSETACDGGGFCYTWFR